MLERTAGCLESGSLRRLLPGPDRSLTSSRILHSTFWTHGAVELDFSPYWQAVARAPESSDNHESQTPRHVLAASSGVFLDFLYPSGTIQSLRNYPTRLREIHEAPRARTSYVQSGHRPYTTLAKDERLLSTKQSEDHKENEKLHKEHRQSSTTSDWSSKLSRLLVGQIMEDTEEAWRFFELITPQEREIYVERMMEYLSKSKRDIDARRVVRLFNSMDDMARSSYHAHSAVLKAHLTLENDQEVYDLIPVIMDKFSTAAGSEFALSRAVMTCNWGQAAAIWRSYMSFSPPGFLDSQHGRFDIWHHLRMQSEFQAKALELMRSLQDRQYTSKLRKARRAALAASRLLAMRQRLRAQHARKALARKFGGPSPAEAQKKRPKRTQIKLAKKSQRRLANKVRKDRAMKDERNPERVQIRLATMAKVDQAKHIPVSMDEVDFASALAVQAKHMPAKMDEVDFASALAVQAKHMPAKMDEVYFASALAVQAKHMPVKTDEVDFASALAVEAAVPLSRDFDAARHRSLINGLTRWRRLKPPDYKLIIRRLLRDDHSESATTLYRQFRLRPDYNLNVRMLENIMEIFSRYTSVLGIQQVLADLFRLHGKPSQKAYNVSMKFFARLGDLKTVQTLWNQYIPPKIRRKKRSLVVTAKELVPLLHVHAKRGELAEAVAFFDNIESEYGIKPDVTLYNILLNAHHKAHDIDGAFERFNELLLSPIRPDDYTYGTMMSLCVARGDLAQAMELYQQAETLGVQRSTAMVASIVLGHVQEDRLSHAEKICEDAVKMLRKNKGNMTRMWNFLITWYAMHRDLENTNRILRRMKALGIRYDSETYGALMQVLGMVGQAEKAYSILRHVLPGAGIQPTSFHFAIVMGGYLSTGEVDFALQVHGDMVNRQIPDDMSTRLMLLKASAARDQHSKEKVNLDKVTGEILLARADDNFDDYLRNANPKELANPQRKGVGRQPLDSMYDSSFFSTMMLLYAQNDAVERVKDLYSFYRERSSGSGEGQPPLMILEALMASKLRQEDHEGVQKCWKLAYSETCSRAQPISTGIDAGTTDWKILPIHQFALAKHLTTLILSLGRQSKFDELATVIAQMQEKGFKLDSRNWNCYAQHLAKAGKYKTAFYVCEDQLMPGWTGWAMERWQAPVRNRLSLKVRHERSLPDYARPVYHTLLYLAKAFLELEESVSESKTALYVFDDLLVRCPKTVNALRTMKRTDEPLEREVLRS